MQMFATKPDDFAVKSCGVTGASLVTDPCKIRGLLSQLHVLSFGFSQYGDVGISVVPQSEEIFVSSQRPYARSIGIRPGGIFRL
jgi:hypothetical protein